MHDASGMPPMFVSRDMVDDECRNVWSAALGISVAHVEGLTSEAVSCCCIMYDDDEKLPLVVLLCMHHHHISFFFFFIWRSIRLEDDDD